MNPLNLHLLFFISGAKINKWENFVSGFNASPFPHLFWALLLHLVSRMDDDNALWHQTISIPAASVLPERDAQRQQCRRPPTSSCGLTDWLSALLHVKLYFAPSKKKSWWNMEGTVPPAPVSLTMFSSMGTCGSVFFILFFCRTLGTCCLHSPLCIIFSIICCINGRCDLTSFVHAVF